MKELSPRQIGILKSLANEVLDDDGWLVHGKVIRAYCSMPNTRSFPDFGEPNPEWPLEELEKEGLVEAIPLQDTGILEWTITPAGATAIGKTLIEKESPENPVDFP